jgi:hypothetical protein
MQMQQLKRADNMRNVYGFEAAGFWRMVSGIKHGLRGIRITYRATAGIAKNATTRWFPERDRERGLI